MKQEQYRDDLHYPDAIKTNDSRVNLVDFIESLSPMERAVLKIRSDNPSITNVATAKLLCVTEGRVRAIRKHIQAKYAKIMA